MEDGIKNIGTVLQTDADGHIIKAASKDKTQSKWRPAVDMAVSVCKQHLSI